MLYVFVKNSDAHVYVFGTTRGHTDEKTHERFIIIRPAFVRWTSRAIFRSLITFLICIIFECNFNPHVQSKYPHVLFDYMSTIYCVICTVIIVYIDALYTAYFTHLKQFVKYVIILVFQNNISYKFIILFLHF